MSKYGRCLTERETDESERDQIMILQTVSQSVSQVPSVVSLSLLHSLYLLEK